MSKAKQAEQTVDVFLRLPVDLARRLDLEVEATNAVMPGVSRQAVVRAALIVYLDTKEAERKRRR